MGGQLELICRGRHKEATPTTTVVTIHGSFTRTLCGPCAASLVARGLGTIVGPIEACIRQPLPTVTDDIYGVTQ